MRKCRKLADKFKILILAVLVACSTFFYAPMGVDAQVSGEIVPEVLDDETQFPDVKTRSVGSSVTTLNRYVYFSNLTKLTLQIL